jgi:hypothetical protein
MFTNSFIGYQDQPSPFFIAPKLPDIHDIGLLPFPAFLHFAACNSTFSHILTKNSLGTISDWNAASNTTSSAFQLLPAISPTSTKYIEVSVATGGNVTIHLVDGDCFGLVVYEYDLIGLDADATVGFGFSSELAFIVKNNTVVPESVMTIEHCPTYSVQFVPEAAAVSLLNNGSLPFDFTGFSIPGAQRAARPTAKGRIANAAGVIGRASCGLLGALKTGDCRIRPAVDIDSPSGYLLLTLDQKTLFQRTGRIWKSEVAGATVVDLINRVGNQSGFALSRLSATLPKFVCPFHHRPAEAQSLFSKAARTAYWTSKQRKLMLSVLVQTSGIPADFIEFASSELADFRVLNGGVVPELISLFDTIRQNNSDLFRLLAIKAEKYVREPALTKLRVVRSIVNDTEIDFVAVDASWISQKGHGCRVAISADESVEFGQITIPGELRPTCQGCGLRVRRRPDQAGPEWTPVRTSIHQLPC